MGTTSREGSTSIQNCTCSAGYVSNTAVTTVDTVCKSEGNCTVGNYLHTAATGSTDVICAPCKPCAVGSFMDVAVTGALYCNHQYNHPLGNMSKPTKCLPCSRCADNQHAPNVCLGDGHRDINIKLDCQLCATCPLGNYIISSTCPMFGGSGVAQCAQCSSCGVGKYIGFPVCDGTGISQLNSFSDTDCRTCCTTYGETATVPALCDGLHVMNPEYWNQGTSCVAPATPSPTPAPTPAQVTAVPGLTTPAVLSATTNVITAVTTTVQPSQTITPTPTVPGQTTTFTNPAPGGTTTSTTATTGQTTTRTTTQIPTRTTTPVPSPPALLPKTAQASTVSTTVVIGAIVGCVAGVGLIAAGSYVAISRHLFTGYSQLMATSV